MRPSQGGLGDRSVLRFAIGGALIPSAGESPRELVVANDLDDGFGRARHGGIHRIADVLWGAQSEAPVDNLGCQIGCQPVDGDHAEPPTGPLTWENDVRRQGLEPRTRGLRVLRRA